MKKILVGSKSFVRTSFKTILNSILGGALLNFSFPYTASAQSFQRGYHVNLYGYPISCVASTGQQIPFFADPQSTRLARQYGGGFAVIDQHGPRIALDLDRLRALPPHAALFVVYHECAHLVLPMGVGVGSPRQERNADCYAIQAMRRHGALPSWLAFRSAMQSVDFGHGIDPSRISHMLNCIAWQ